MQLLTQQQLKNLVIEICKELPQIHHVTAKHKLGLDPIINLLDTTPGLNHLVLFGSDALQEFLNNEDLKKVTDSIANHSVDCMAFCRLLLHRSLPSVYSDFTLPKEDRLLPGDILMVATVNADYQLMAVNGIHLEINPDTHTKVMP